MTSLSAFARERGVEPKTVSIYMKRHKMVYRKTEGLTPDQLEELDKVYPLPKPVIIQNGLSQEEERKLRQALEEALSRLADANEQVAQLTEKVSRIQLLEDKQAEQAAELERLKNRNIWERIINK